MKHETLLEALVTYAKTQPEKTAVYLLNSSDINLIDADLKYGQLFESVYNLAETIKKHSRPGDRALLCYPTGLDFIIAFYACLWAKVIAVAVVVPTNVGLMKKIEAIDDNCKPTLVLTDSKTFDQCIQETVKRHDVQILVTDTIQLNAPVNFDTLFRPDIKSNDVAFLQYTSGSTSEPKGVMVSHGNLLSNIHDMTEAFNSTSDSIGLNWLPHTHDMGLIGSFLHSVHKGAVIYLMSPTSFIRRPMMWLQALSTYHVEITGGPCFALQLCLDTLSPEKIQTLNLASLRYIIIGSEPISEEVISQFFDKLKPTGLSKQAFSPSYGLAEATLMVSSRTGSKAIMLDYLALNQNVATLANAESQHAVTVLSCGKPYLSVAIVSPETKLLCSENTLGEVWLQGKSIAQGYWQNPVETKNNFNVTPTGVENQRFFRTGDLGFLNQGELYIVGRIKDVIIINGLNYYPQDIEQVVLLCDDRLHRANCAVFCWRPIHAVTDSFVVLVNLRKRLPDEDYVLLTTKIKKQILIAFQLVPHDVQFVHASLPKTTSGKLQRNACKQLYQDQCEQQATRVLYV